MENSDSYRDQQFVKRHNFAPSLALKLAPQTDLLLYATPATSAPDGLQHPGAERPPGERGPPAPTTAPATPRRTTPPPAPCGRSPPLNHRFSDDWSVRNVTRAYDYTLDRYNTLSGGTTDPVTMTVGRTRSFILRDERACSTRPT